MKLLTEMSWPELMSAVLCWAEAELPTVGNNPAAATSRNARA